MASSVETDELTSPTSKSLLCTTEGCDCQFKKKSQLRQHLIDVHGDTEAIKPYECQTCKRKFQTNAHLKRHEKVHNGYRCETCKLTYNTWSELRKHRAQIHKPFSIRCEACRTKFNSRTDLNYHKEYCEEKEKLTCAICNKTFSKKENLKKHLKTVHHCQRDYSCVNCNKEFLHAHNVVNHLALCFARSEEGLLDQTSFTADNLKEVITSSLNGGISDDNEFQCNGCRKTFKYRRSLWRHQKENCPMLEPSDRLKQSKRSLFEEVDLGFEPRSLPMVQANDGNQINWDASPVVKIVKMSRDRTESLMDERCMSSDCERDEHPRHLSSQEQLQDSEDQSLQQLSQQNQFQKMLFAEPQSVNTVHNSLTYGEPSAQSEQRKEMQDLSETELVMPELIKYKEGNRIIT